MKRFLFTALAVLVTTCPGLARLQAAVEYTENDATHGITSLRISGDAVGMEWLVKTDGTQYPWVTGKYEWGTAYFDADGEVETTVQRRHDANDQDWALLYYLMVNE